MQNMDDLTRLNSAVKALISQRRKHERLLEKSHTDLSSKQAQKNSADLAWSGMELDKLDRAAHAAAVDCGIADLRTPSNYEAIEYNPSGWHRYKHQPEAPRALAEQVPS